MENPQKIQRRKGNSHESACSGMLSLEELEMLVEESKFLHEASNKALEALELRQSEKN